MLPQGIKGKRKPKGESMLTAETGDTVKVNYVGRLADGTIFDTSEGKPPLHFILGKQEVIPGFDRATHGMVQGEKKSVTISCDDAYGPYHEKLVETIEVARLPDDLDLTLGGQLEVSREDGQKMYFLIKALTETTVTLDANHPLAGKELNFEIEMLEVKKTSSQK
jgi:peptidylprolyl isomerase